MLTYKFTRLVLAFLLSGTVAESQIALSYAREEKNLGNMVAYRVEWNYGSQTTAGIHANKFLNDRGYKNAFSQPCEKCGLNLVKGYFVVVKSESVIGGVHYTTFGMGASENSYEEAELRAGEHLKVSSSFYNPSQGYKVIERGTYGPEPVKQFIYIIKSKKSPCGENAFDFSYMLGSYPNSMYAKIFRGFKNQNSSDNPVINQVGHIIRENGYIGILKCNQQCPDGTVRSQYKVVEAETADEIKSMAPNEKDVVSPAGQTNFFVDKIFEPGKDNGSSILRENFNLFDQFLGIEYKGTIADWASSGVRN
jgi:hypothetical protein